MLFEKHPNLLNIPFEFVKLYPDIVQYDTLKAFLLEVPMFVWKNAQIIPATFNIILNMITGCPQDTELKLSTQMLSDIYQTDRPGMLHNLIIDIGILCIERLKLKTIDLETKLTLLSGLFSSTANSTGGDLVALLEQPMLIEGKIENPSDILAFCLWRPADKRDYRSNFVYMQCIVSALLVNSGFVDANWFIEKYITYIN